MKTTNMRTALKLEEIGLLLIVCLVYFEFYEGGWVLFASLFFAPDLAFLAIIVNKKVATIAYNAAHHKGLISLLMIIGYLLSNELLILIGLIFMAHSCFDRMLGYGLKYFDSFDHTHLGWMGKSKHKNLEV
ncbi:hypothetical protein AWN68_05845 [Roseivirga echinicomitans]|uniref:DUF4260 domain-containing protein n=2 Tax=Roseivirga echinicomitans TaxID=296218 RepID=A0A150XCX4_9BACT|nr:hypothetical protein AWN68_05845 [Roseivirga echinicomitans]